MKPSLTETAAMGSHPSLNSLLPKGILMASQRKIRNAAIAYLVWSKASKAGWDVTLSERADAAAEYFGDNDITTSVIMGICNTRRSQGKSWMDLLRCTSPADVAGYVR